MPTPSDWTPPDIAIVLLTAATLLVATLALVQQLVSWRRSGPLAVVRLTPGAHYGETLMAGTNAADIANQVPEPVQPVVVLTIGGSGRLPVYIRHIRFETVAWLRRDSYRWWTPWRRGRYVFIPINTVFGGQPGRVDAVEPKDFAYAWAAIEGLAAAARAQGHKDHVRAVVILGNLKRLRSNRFSPSKPKRSAYEQMTPREM